MGDYSGLHLLLRWLTVLHGFNVKIDLTVLMMRQCFEHPRLKQEKNRIPGSTKPVDTGAQNKIESQSVDLTA
ncbi:hypothetical protein B0F90DRAFT_1756290 [Multifurca ochricompacta]|uniref:Uncharacterized protein n=1 Tax=Multifurca ochricompacta TaxID=376703 RepID=A0AAD4QHN4_9AGAM|nr:hypothetical protein B0F90DRAFT_1756290 [Multifurca ochricompacta]